MPYLPELGQLLSKWTAAAVEGFSGARMYTSIATLSVAQTCLELLQSGIAQDIQRVKEALIRRTEAETEIKVAEAKQRLAEAAVAANIADLPKRNDALARIHKDVARLAVQKAEVEIKAIEEELRLKRVAAVAEARARLMEAISSLRENGGEVFLDKTNLNLLMQLPDDPEPED